MDRPVRQVMVKEGGWYTEWEKGSDYCSNGKRMKFHMVNHAEISSAIEEEEVNDTTSVEEIATTSDSDEASVANIEGVECLKIDQPYESENESEQDIIVSNGAVHGAQRSASLNTRAEQTLNPELSHGRE